MFRYEKSAVEGSIPPQRSAQLPPLLPRRFLWDRADGPATLYCTLKKLVAQGVAEESGRPSADDGQRRRRYRLTGLGERVCADEADRRGRTRPHRSGQPPPRYGLTVPGSHPPKYAAANTATRCGASRSPHPPGDATTRTAQCYHPRKGPGPSGTMNDPTTGASSIPTVEYTTLIFADGRSATLGTEPAAVSPTAPAYPPWAPPGTCR